MSALAELVDWLRWITDLGPRPPGEKGLDWLPLIEAHELAPLIAHRDPPAALAEALEPTRITAIHDATFRTYTLARLLQRLPDCVVLKGPALAHMLYAAPVERSFWDLDLLFAERAAAERARARLCAAGYEATQDLPGHHHLGFLRDPVAEFAVELHLDLCTPGIGEAAVAELYARRAPLRVAGVDTLALDPAGMVVHLALHAGADPMGTPLLRNLLEIAWLGARLEPEEAAWVGDFVARHALARAALGLWQAATLFEVTPLVPKPRPSVAGLVSRRRLLWSPDTRLAALRDDLASDLVGGGGVVSTLRAHLGAALRTRRPAGLLRRSEGLRTTPLAAGALVHDTRTGEVHLLSRDAAEAWAVTEHPVRLRALPPATREILRALTRRGLLVGRN